MIGNFFFAPPTAPGAILFFHNPSQSVYNGDYTSGQISET